MRIDVDEILEGVNILLVDDDDVAIEGVLRSFKKENVICPIVTAGDGLEALEILRGTHPHKAIEQPMLVLLDLNMPRMDGFQFLSQIRADKHLRDLVVFVLTTSGLDSDRNKAYHENVAGYMVKSAVGPQFSKLARLLRLYGNTVSLPRA